jgi:hypothetical protein
VNLAKVDVAKDRSGRNELARYIKEPTIGLYFGKRGCSRVLSAEDFDNATLGSKGLLTVLTDKDPIVLRTSPIQRDWETAIVLDSQSRSW